MAERKKEMFTLPLHIVLRARVHHVHHVKLGDDEVGCDPFLVIRHSIGPNLHELVNIAGVDSNHGPGEDFKSSCLKFRITR